MKKLIVDFEATCCAVNEFPRNEMEIIEIGAVLLGENGEEIARYHNCVRPVKNPDLTEFCKTLTGITQKDVNLADPFESEINNFLNWIIGETDDDFIFYSWGDFDKNILTRQCDEYELGCDWLINKHQNAKVKFAEKYNIRPKGVGSALRFKGWMFQGQAHRALDDALNIARLVNLL